MQKSVVFKDWGKNSSDKNLVSIVYSLLFHCWDKTPWPKLLRGGRLSWGSITSQPGSVAAGRLGGWSCKLQARILNHRKQRTSWKWCETLNSQCSPHWHTSSTNSPVPKPPQTGHKRKTNNNIKNIKKKKKVGIQMPETMGHLLNSNHQIQYVKIS